MTKEDRGALFTGVLYFIGIALYISGGIHSAKKHHEGSLAWWCPPWGLYRGVEQFWHNDYAGVDWEDKLHADTKVLFYLIYTNNEKKKDELKFQNDVADFKEQIKNYPKDKIAILKNNARTYIALLKSMDDDFLTLIHGDTIFYKKDFFSQKSKILLDSVGVLSDSMEENDFKIGVAEAFGDNDTTLFIPSESKQAFAASLASSNDKLESTYNEIFKGL